ncbi:hypothetical protein [[Limnothrix rosea] IAM M-220]|uniref:hypothetical protein n=1 Tax=[Limnothrix rosea] IAM M-220 TaxID=454133 RepID=UPI000959C89D|nr:hypothetical protein [[Limnothrix rosea] IAM M-220]OKH18728.1 hypothetical protein NIES208_04500 [[Limnothrix rosea] IAM M-220]
MFKTISTKLSVAAIATVTAFTSVMPAVASPSVNGRYSELIQKMNCPQARDEYGSYNHYGYWEGNDYICGDQYAEEGYWVYEYPYWYVWNNDNQAQSARASVNGRYEDLVQTIYCPRAEAEYGSFNNYGYWEGGDYICGDQYAEEGYWVYDFPTWYVWRYDNRTDDAAIDNLATVNGKYTELAQVLTCYEDGDTYGEYYDYGYWSGGSWCGEYGAEGYWVYVYPDWYIWEREVR